MTIKYCHFVVVLYQSFQSISSTGPSGSSDPIGAASFNMIIPKPHQFHHYHHHRCQGLSIAHVISTEAVKVSFKTVGFGDEMFQQVMGGSEPESIPCSGQSISSVPSLSALACPLPSQNGVPMPQPTYIGCSTSNASEHQSQSSNLR